MQCFIQQETHYIELLIYTKHSVKHYLHQKFCEKNRLLMIINNKQVLHSFLQHKIYAFKIN
jgi:hypothetical protein